MCGADGDGERVDLRRVGLRPEFTGAPEPPVCTWPTGLMRSLASAATVGSTLAGRAAFTTNTAIPAIRKVKATSESSTTVKAVEELSLAGAEWAFTGTP